MTSEPQVGTVADVRSRQEFVAEWSGRVGQEAAQLAVTSARCVGLGGILVPIWALLFVVGHDSPLVLAGAFALLLIDVVLLAVGVERLHRQNALLSQRFGTQSSGS